MLFLYAISIGKWRTRRCWYNEQYNTGFQNLLTLDVVKYEKVIPIFLFIFLAPIVGMIVSVIITLIIVFISRKSITTQSR